MRSKGGRLLVRIIGKDSKIINKDSRIIGKDSRIIGKDSKIIGEGFQESRIIGKDSREVLLDYWYGLRYCIPVQYLSLANILIRPIDSPDK